MASVVMLVGKEKTLGEDLRGSADFDNVNANPQPGLAKLEASLSKAVFINGDVRSQPNQPTKFIHHEMLCG